MPARSAMVHRALVERDMQEQTDAWNQTAAPDWRTHLHDLACRVWYDNGDEIQDGAKVAAVNRMRAIVPLGTDISVEDRIAAVTDRLGAELFAGPLRITAVARRRDHLALSLEVV